MLEAGLEAGCPVQAHKHPCHVQDGAVQTTSRCSELSYARRIAACIRGAVFMLIHRRLGFLGIQAAAS